jgi:hypothetical protein
MYTNAGITTIYSNSELHLFHFYYQMDMSMFTRKQRLFSTVYDHETIAFPSLKGCTKRTILDNKPHYLCALITIMPWNEILKRHIK